MSCPINLEIAREIAAANRAATAIEAAAPVAGTLHLNTVTPDAYTAQMARMDALASGAAGSLTGAEYGKLEVSVDGPERKYYTLRTLARMGGYTKGGSLGRTLHAAMSTLIERGVKGFCVVVIEDVANDLRNKQIGFGKYADATLNFLMESENEAHRKYVSNIAGATRMIEGKPCLFWDGGLMKKDIKKAIPMWLYTALAEIKAEQTEIARAYKAEATEAKAATSFHVGQIDQRIKADTLTCTKIIAYIDSKVFYINGETHSFKARFTNKDGQIVECYCSRDQYQVGESFACAMTPKKHYITKDGDRVTLVNRITKK